jgi:hypothetical protein
MEEKEKTILDEVAVLKQDRLGKYRDIGFPVESAGATKEQLVYFAKKTWDITKDVLHSDIALLDRILAYVQEVFDSSGRGLEELDASKRPEPDVGRVMPGPDDASREERLRVMLEYREYLRKEIQIQDSRSSRLEQIKAAVVYGSMLEGSDGQCTALGAARWCNNGFPQVTMGHKYCSYLMASTMSPEAADYVKPPWNAFVIEVPNDILFLTDSDTKQEHVIRRILVLRLSFHKRGEEYLWGYIAFTDSSLSLWRYGVSAAELSAPTEEGMVMGEGSQEFTAVDERLAIVIGRLVINTCLAMSDPTNIKKTGAGHKEYEKGAHRTSDEPVVRTFQIGKPVKLDFREAIQRYIRYGAKKMPSVQVLVCGHYKMQPYGPRHSLRKLLWIQPFWRGPEDAPILVRPHELGTKEKETT